MTAPAAGTSGASGAAAAGPAAVPVDAVPVDAAPAGSVPADAAPARLGGPVWVALGVVYVLWGSTYLAIRIALETMPSFLSAAARFLTAGLLLVGFVAIRYGRSGLRVDLRQLGSSVLVGVLLLTGGNGLVVLGENSIPSGLAALLVAVVPLWMVLLTAAGGDRPKAVELAGVMLGLVGLGVLSAPAIGGDIAKGGVIAVVCGTLTWAFGSFAAKRIRMPGNVFAASAYQMLAGGLGNTLIGLVRGEQYGLDLGAVSGRSWLALGFLVVFGSLVAYTAYAWLLRSAPLGLVATYAYVNPVVAVLLGWLVLAEPLTRPTLLGGAIVVVGVCLVVSVSRTSSRK
ncbi:EamA family transporter [Kitasatospora sp. NBC_00458]|uniref:EamA family transporter n=1 Tax=Kitasatospora sp. NBC_00458 TaxID=2903568 RepID=UPI002E189E53